MTTLLLGSSVRKSDTKVEKLFLDRWSPRSMSSEKITKAELMTLFEAARWAPSCYNEQPWRFIYALRETPQWKPLFDLMVEFNQNWVKNAAALVLVLSRNTSTHNGAPFATHSFDTGAAWGSFALQGTASGLVVHGMAGFDYDKARTALKIPDHYTVECMVAVGKPDDKSKLPGGLAEKEVPSQRKPLSEIAFEGTLTE